jgi:hypothetical protein
MAGLGVLKGEGGSNESLRHIEVVYMVLWTEAKDRFDHHSAGRQFPPKKEEIIKDRIRDQVLTFFLSRKYFANPINFSC